MSKILEATCVGGVVKVGDLPVEDTVVLSEGVGSSSGLLLLEGLGKHYVARTTPDLDTTLQKVMDALLSISSALTTISSTLTAIGTGMTGPTTAPPAALATGVATILTKVTEITTARTSLVTLKGNLK